MMQPPRTFAARGRVVLDRWFPDRQLLVRGPGHVSVLRLSQKRQLWLAGGALVAGLWLVTASVATVMTHQAASKLRREAGFVRATLFTERARLTNDHAALAGQTNELARRLAELDSQAAENVALGSDLAKSADLLAHTDEAQIQLASTQLQQRLAGAPDWATEVQQKLVERQVALDRALADRTRAIAERDQALQRLADTEAASRAAVAQLTEQTRDAIQDVAKIVTSTGLDLDHLAPPHLPDHRDERGLPRGGPFVPWPVPSPTAAPPHEADHLLSDVDRLQELTQLLRQLPLSAPVGVVSVSSPFGYRLDPFTGRASLHEGIDFQGARGTPIMATAPGRVAYAGPRTDYGNVVELDHGFGLMTRYAHLTRALVSTGDLVALHQMIGLMGSTGRATGVHLHYEVRVDGAAQNPARFMKANNYVFEQK